MGAIERGLLRQGLRYALALRLVVVGASIPAAALAAAPDPTATAAVVLGLNAWNVCYAAVLLRGPPGARRWLVPVDVAVMCGVCLAQVWTITPDPGGRATWVLVAVQVTVVTYAWQIGWPALAAATLTIVAAYHAGSTAAGDWPGDQAVALWTVVQAALSWALYRLVRRGARTADRVVERGEQLRRAVAVAAARRSDEREYLAALHDTAAATLLMVGGGVAARRETWLAEQARHDLQEIDASGVAAVGEVDLLDLLRGVVAHTPLRVAWSAPESVRLPAADAMSLSRGAREALTNVVRHAGTDHAEIRVRPDDDAVTVQVVDDGRGFDPGQAADHRYGVTRSLGERMARTGGSARIESRPGRGTTVTMTCPRAGPELHSDDAGIIAVSFQRGLRWGVVVLSLAILLLLDLPRLLAGQYAYREVWPQFVTWGVLLAVTLAAAVATWRNRSLGGWRWPLVLLVFACSALATASVRPQYLLRPEHWSAGNAGWPAVLLMLDTRLAALITVLVVQYAITFGQAALVEPAALSVAGAVNAVWDQLAVAMIAAVLRGLAVSSARAARAGERLRTAEEVARHLHADRTARYSGLVATAVPLLQGLADGELDPGDGAVRRACAAEATRMRRLFAADDAVSDPLMHELLACVESAESNGVPVAFAEYGTRPELPPTVRRRLTEPAIAALATARGPVRLTVAGTPGRVTVSVIADCPPVASAPDGDGVRRSTVQDGDRLWIQTTWGG